MLHYTLVNGYEGSRSQLIELMDKHEECEEEPYSEAEPRIMRYSLSLIIKGFAIIFTQILLVSLIPTPLDNLFRTT
ncbi:MAG: hypothetical protein QXR45_07060 [Candidatus Bathyarchaeia archaeon]